MLAHCEPQHAGWRGIDTMKVARETHVQAPVCSADIIAEVLAIIVSGLDCEGTRKLASVNKTFRSRSYVAIAVAEFRESQIQLLGLFQSFQVAALRDGRMRLSGASGKNTASVANGKRAFVATVEDNSSLASISHDVEYISTLDSKAKHAAASQISRGNASKGPRPDLQTIGGSQYCEDTVIECGTLKAHSSNKGVRLPLNLSMKLRRSLSDREQRLLALGEGFQKKVLCTFKVGKQHGTERSSAKCSTCNKYACTECHEAQRCSSCQLTFCNGCWELGSPDICGICHELICSHCRDASFSSSSSSTSSSHKDNARASSCSLCPVYLREHMCRSCEQLPHCAACERHCSSPPRACDSCGEGCCADCIKESPYCQLCGEFSLW